MSSTPRLALARDLMRCAVLQGHDAPRMVIETLSHRVYAMTDAEFEDQFLDVIDLREAAFAEARRIGAEIAGR